MKLCKAEIEAASRIAICALKLFKIESAIPESAVEHLSDLGKPHDFEQVSCSQLCCLTFQYFAFNLLFHSFTCRLV